MNITQEGEDQKSIIEQMIPLYRKYNEAVAEIQVLLEKEGPYEFRKSYEDLPENMKNKSK